MELEFSVLDLGQTVYLLRALGLSEKKISKMIKKPMAFVKPIVKIVDASNQCMNELLSARKPGNSDAEEAKLFGASPGEVEDLKRMAVDPTTPVCDVCGPSKRISLGGVVLEEEDGTFTMVCQGCWDTFTNKPDDLKLADTWFKRLALSSGIGTDPDRVVEWLDVSRRFDDNVRDFIVRQGNKDRNFCTHRNQIDYCVGCMRQFDESELARCERCKKTRYCGRMCMEADRPRHEPGCSAYLRSLETQEKFALPDESESCEGCGSYSFGVRFMKCSRCLKATYCNKNCQTVMWKKHKLTCKSPPASSCEE